MKVEHPNFPNKDNVSNNPNEVKVSTVLPHDDEDALFASQMNEVVNTPASSKEVKYMDDSIINKELEKKTALEKLVLFKQPVYKEVVIEGVKFRLKLLNANENSLVYEKLRELPTDHQLTKAPLMLLAAALVDANGIKIEDTYSGPDKIDTSLMKKYYELNSWNMPIINILTKSYRQFTDEVEGNYNKDFLDKSQKTDSTE